MPRFFCPMPLAVDTQIQLPEKVAHHIHVCRLELQQQICLFNGAGGEYIATLTLIEKKRVLADIKLFSPREVELPHALTLAQALPESAKMDWIIEKAVELGASAIQPLSTQRCVTRLSGERAEKRHEHWQRIIQAGAEQCGRNRLPQLAPVLDFQDWASQHDLHRRILLTPRAEQSLADWARHHPPQALTLVIGPEGGFSETEQQLASQRGMLELSIGARILRTETAGLAALAGLNALWDVS